MDIISSMLSIVKNVNDTERQFKLLREKLTFNIKKAETSLQKYKKQNHKHTFFADNLESRLKDASQKLEQIENILSSDNNGGISLKDKFKLSLPFNNEKDKIGQILQDLKQATQEILNDNNTDLDSGVKKKVEVNIQQEVDNQIEQAYEMGPTIQENNGLEFAHEFTKNHTIQLTIKMLGSANILELITAANKEILIEHLCERVSKVKLIELWKLGRMNFKNEYKFMKAKYPDIDKISKLSHFVVKWQRSIVNEDNHNNVENQLNYKKSQSNVEGSQKKEEQEMFFSVPDVQHSEFDNGCVILDKENKILYRKRGESWIKVEQQTFEIVNGQQVAISLNKQMIPDIYFKINYRWK